MKSIPSYRVAKQLAGRRPASPGKSGRRTPAPSGASPSTSPARGPSSMSDLQIPVKDLLTAGEERRLGESIQGSLERLQRFLPALIPGYEIYLRNLSAFAIGETIVVAWFPLKERLRDDLEKATACLDRVRTLLRRAGKLTPRIEKKAQQELSRGVKILRRYPLSPEQLYSWSREAILESRNVEPFNRLRCQAKVRSVLDKVLSDLESARDQMVLPNFRLILKEVFRFNPSGMRRSDLFQEGILGLHRAVFRYDPSKKTRFSTYATYWIRQAIRKSLIDRSRLIRIPQAVQEELRNPETHIRPEEVRRVRQIMTGTVSMSAESEDDPRDRLEFEAIRMSRSPGSEELHVGVIPGEVEKALRKLTTREREVVSRRFGIGGARAQTLEEIGVAMHLSRERIRQIEREALGKMKTHSDLQAVYEELS